MVNLLHDGLLLLTSIVKVVCGPWFQQPDYCSMDPLTMVYFIYTNILIYYNIPR